MNKYIYAICLCIGFINISLAHSAGHVYLGVALESTKDIAHWEKTVGKRAHIIHMFYRLSSEFPWRQTRRVLKKGYAVMLTLEPRLRGDHKKKSRLKDIYHGQLDKNLNHSIQMLKSIYHDFPKAQIMIRFGHEMNGAWYRWGCKNNHNQNTAQDFILAFQYVVKFFRQHDLKQVRWVWSPNVSYRDDFSVYYPGDQYVDIIGMSGFNFGPNTSYRPDLTWQTFSEIYDTTYHVLKNYPKPLMITGIACAESGGNKATWLKDMQYQLKHRYQRITGLIWFNLNKEADWRIDSSQESLKASQILFSDHSLWH
ncbi:MAG: glycosyl hydrolase [Mariprofundaceae bacterium]|nr:glycosyl hydrolase [Mariprofundaceae bacterium]